MSSPPGSKAARLAPISPAALLGREEQRSPAAAPGPGKGGEKKNALLSIARGKQASCDLPVVQRESQTPAGGLRRGRSSVRVPFIYSSRLDAFRFYTRLNLLSPGRRNTGSPAAPQPPPGPSPEPDPRGRPWAAPGPRGAPRSTARGQPRRKPSSSRRVAPGRHRHHGVGCRRPAPLLVKRGESRPSAPGRSTETGLPSSPLSPQVPRHSAVRPADAPAPTRPRTRADPETTRRSPPAPRPAAPGSTAAIRAAPAAPGRAPLGRGGGGTSGGAGLPEGAGLTGGNGRGLWFGGVVKGLGRGLRVGAGPKGGGGALCSREVDSSLESAQGVEVTTSSPCTYGIVWAGRDPKRPRSATPLQ